MGERIMAEDRIQYVSDANGNAVAVIVPIELWQEIESEKETAYLLKSETMKRRLLDANQRRQDFSLEEARERAGL
jgi:PHD/YefM family antitoxin component YafN of YafNO toxin-antitoxin module